MASAERHPIPDAPSLPLERRVHLLECHLAMLWDQVWWMNLPFWRRWYYRAQGFTDPLRRFYIPPGDDRL